MTTKKTKEVETVMTWEEEVKNKLNEFIDNMLIVSKECNMATKYFKPVKEQYEGSITYDDDKISGAELRIVFNFAGPVDLDTVRFT